MSDLAKDENATVFKNKDGEEVIGYEPPAYFGKDSKLPPWLQSTLMDLWFFVTIHYNFYQAVALYVFYRMYQSGYGLVAIALIALYAPYFFNGTQYTGNGGQWEALRGLELWNVWANYLKLELVREEPLDSSRKHIFGYHPHGIIILSRIATYGGVWEKLFPGIPTRVLGATPVFYVPGGREISLWLGAVDAGKPTANKVLKSGNAMTVYPGGIREMFHVDPKSKENRIILQTRFGFIKLALRHGADLVPTFVFGEKWAYSVWNPPKALRNFVLKYLQMPLTVFWGRIGWVPHRPADGKKFGIVYGKSIKVEQVEEPTEEQVKELHAKYVTEVKRLFETYKKRFGYDDDESLVIV